MRVLLSGSVATDHLMHFPGLFAAQIQPDALDRLSLSFLVDDLVVRHGGVSGNIAFGLGTLGLRPLLVAAVGRDFGEYGERLAARGVDLSAVTVHPTAHTARFLCTTDDAMCQIASFYPGAMNAAADIDLTAVLAAHGGADVVVVSPNEPSAMVRHTREARAAGVMVVADPSQQVARLDAATIAALIDGAAYLFSNDYERGLIETKTGWSGDEVLARVGTRVTTRGPAGVSIESADGLSLTVAPVPERAKVDPTGVGDALRAGFLAALGWGLGPEAAARLGSLLATLTLETVGTQEYEVSLDVALQRLAGAYGADAADELAPHLRAALAPVPAG